MRLLKKQRYSNSQVLNKIRSGKSIGFSRNILAYQLMNGSNYTNIQHNSSIYDNT